MDTMSVYISPCRRAWLFALLSLVLFFLVAPVLIVVPMSFSASNYLQFAPDEWSWRWYQALFSSTEWLTATRKSILAACLTTVVATPLGILAAVALSRVRGATSQ